MRPSLSEQNFVGVNVSLKFWKTIAKKFLSNNELRLSDYFCEFKESTNGCKGEVTLKDADSFTKEEKQEIMESLRNRGNDEDDSDDDEDDNEESE